VENLARSVDKEEKTLMELIIRAYFLERISRVANTTRRVVLFEMRSRTPTLFTSLARLMLLTLEYRI